jgi:hypothetical protein
MCHLQHKLIVLDFKLSLCSVLTVSTFGCTSCVWFILADVSEPLKLEAFEDGPDKGFRNVGQYKPDAGDTPKSGNS